MQVVGEAASGEEAIAKARRLIPDVVLMDLLMPGKGGVEAIRILRAEVPATRILVLSAFDEDTLLLAALQAGTHGYLRKDTSTDELFVAIRHIAKGGSYLPQRLSRSSPVNLQGPRVALRTALL